MWRQVVKIGFFFPQSWKLAIIGLVIAVTALSPAENSERIGDRFQFALPIMGFMCSLSNGEVIDYAIRYATVEVIMKSSKIGLGEAKINERPNGYFHGFPSGHTSAAAYGASYLVHACIDKNLLVKGAVILSAGYVGGSRIEADKHTLFQVLFGALLGWGCDRLFRRMPTPLQILRGQISRARARRQDRQDS